MYRIENAKAAKSPAQKRAGTATTAAKSPSTTATTSSDGPFEVGYGKAADWWSLGVMIFEMLSGTPAFRGRDLRQTYQKVLFADLVFEPADRFSEDAKDLLRGLLDRSDYHHYRHHQFRCIYLSP